MSLLGMVEARLPPGFRFHPRDDELICDYLLPKATGNDGRSSFACPMMTDVDLNKCEPWDLPETACVGSKEWYFFSLRDRKYATGQRTNRATLSGYWKATGKDRQVARKGAIVGMRKTLVFYQGRAPKGKKTEWVMHEFRMEAPRAATAGRDPPPPNPKILFREDWVLCRVFYKNRGICSKENMETSYDDNMSSSSSLPPLMDTLISFDHTAAPLQTEGLQQVPCFSNLLHNSGVPPPTATATITTATTVKGSGSAQLVGLTQMAQYLSPMSSDPKVFKAVLSHLTKLEGREASSLAHQLVSGSYFSESGLPSMLNHF